MVIATSTKQAATRPTRRSVVTTLLLLVTVSAMICAGAVELAELRTLDLLFALRGPRPVSDAVRLVVVDDGSIQQLGRWPWPRDFHADFLRILGDPSRHAPVIGYDVLFTEPQAAHPEEDQALVEAARLTPGLVLAYYFEQAAAEPQGNGSLAHQTVLADHALGGQAPAQRNGHSRIPQLPFAPLDRAAALGFVSTSQDPDGHVRRTLLVRPFQGRWYPSLALRMFLAHRGIAPSAVQVVPGRWVEIPDADGTIRVPIDRQGRMFVDFAGPLEQFRPLSFLDVARRAQTSQVSGQPDSELEALAGQMVVVGMNATGIPDFHVTPVGGQFAGCALHATVLDNLLQQRFIVRPQWVSRGIGLAVALLAILLAGWCRPGRAMLGCGALAGVTIGVAIWLLGMHRIWLDLVTLELGLLASGGAMLLCRYAEEERQRRWIRHAFGRYLSENVLQELLRDPSRLRLGGERRVLSVLFADIRGFTSYCERHSPEEVVAMLNEYMTRMTAVITRNGGTLDKYIGDAIMAVFGAPGGPMPDHPLRACRAACEMLDALEELKAAWKVQEREPFDIGIGINTGEMLVGNMGSEQVMSYTVIGDEVNLAARVEALTRTYEEPILITEATCQAVRDQLATREVAQAMVKGKTKPVTLFAISQPSNGRVHPRQHAQEVTRLVSPVAHTVR